MEIFSFIPVVPGRIRPRANPSNLTSNEFMRLVSVTAPLRHIRETSFLLPNSFWDRAQLRETYRQLKIDMDHEYG